MPPSRESPWMRSTTHNAPAKVGAECRESPGLSSEGKYFLLTFPLIEQYRRQFRSGPRTIWVLAPIVNAPGLQVLCMTATNKY